jgi:hypothetical protein
MSTSEYFLIAWCAGIISRRLNEFRTLQVIIAGFLLWSGEFLQAGNGYQNREEFTSLTRIIYDAVDDIRLSATMYIETLSSMTAYTHRNPTAETVQAATLVFPLYCASKAYSLPEAQRRWFRETLNFLGQKTFIPKAMALVRRPGSDTI